MYSVKNGSRGSPSGEKALAKPSGEMPLTKTGRPSLLTPEVQEQICKLLQTGAPLETCAEAIGVWPETLSHWQARARECVARYKGDVEAALKDENQGEYVEFVQAIARARAGAELVLLEKVKAAGKGGWAAGWILERVHRDRYSTRAESRVDATVKVEGGGGADADARARERCDAFLAASTAAAIQEGRSAFLVPGAGASGDRSPGGRLEASCDVGRDGTSQDAGDGAEQAGHTSTGNQANGSPSPAASPPASKVGGSDRWLKGGKA